LYRYAAAESDIMAGEVRGSVLDSFRALVTNLYVPILESQTNWGKNTEENTTEFVQGLSKFGATLTEAVHSLQGGVDLMKPDKKYVDSIDLRPQSFNRAATEPEIAEHIEGVLEDWCTRTEALLEQGEGSRKESDEVGPDTELEYWRNRMAKFNSITEQLKSKECKLVLGVAMVRAVTAVELSVCKPFCV
jgi:dynein heavy chain